LRNVKLEHFSKILEPFSGRLGITERQAVLTLCGLAIRDRQAGSLGYIKSALHLGAVAFETPQPHNISRAKAGLPNPTVMAI
jgi:hypothetical protein